jgi:hypothetical protein
MLSGPPQCGDAAITGGKLLVLTSGRCAGDLWSLALDFEKATIRDIEDPRPINGMFDAAAIEIDPFNIDLVARVIEHSKPHLSDNSRIFVTLAADLEPQGDHDDPEPPERVGLSWLGLTALGSAVYAVMEIDTTETSSPAMMLLAGAHSAIRMQAGLTTRAHREVEALRAKLLAGVEGRRRSEVALIGRVDAVTRELDRVRRQHRGTALVGTLLGRSRPGRMVLLAARPAWRALNGYKAIKRARRLGAAGHTPVQGQASGSMQLPQ